MNETQTIRLPSLAPPEGRVYDDATYPPTGIQPDPDCSNCDGLGCMFCRCRWEHTLHVKDCPVCCELSHRQVLAHHGDRSAIVDEGICEEIELLWRHGIDTCYSCEGRPGAWRYVGLFEATDAQVALACSLLPWVVTVDKSGLSDRIWLLGPIYPLETL